MAVDILTKGQKIGLLQQSKVTNHWSAPAAANATFVTQLYNAGGTVPDSDTQINQFNIAGGGGVMDEYTRVNVDGVSGLPTMGFTGTATKETIAYHLISVFQSVTEAGTTPFAKTFTFADSVLDWAANGGYLYTLAFNTGISGSGVILENALLNTYNLVINPLGRGLDRYVTHSGTWIGNEMNYDQTLSGTWSAPAETFFNTAAAGYEDNLTLNINSVSYANIVFHRFEFQYNANLFSDTKTAGGKANNYKWAPVGMFIIDLPFNATSDAILASHKAGHNAYVTSLTNGIVAGTDGNLGFANTYGILNSNPYVADNNGYAALRLEIKILKPAAGWGTIVTLTDVLDGGF